VVVLAAVVAGGLFALGPRDRQTETQPPPPAPSPVGVAELPRSEQLAPPLAPTLAPAPRPVNRLPLAACDELAAMRKQSLNRMVEWVRMNNRWAPDAEIANNAAAYVAGLPAHVDGLVLVYGGRLLKSQTPTLVFARTGSFFVFELTPEQAQARDVKPMLELMNRYSHDTDARRAVPGVRLSNLQIDDADAHRPEARIDGTITCEFPVAPAAGDHLRITHYRPDGRRVWFLYHPKQVLPSGTVSLRFSANPLEPRTGKGEQLVVLFAEWVSEKNGARAIESNTTAALLVVAGPCP
jgi:hypothetical protein